MPNRSKIREFIDQGDIYVALGVFDDFGSFRHLYAAGFMGSSDYDGAIKTIHILGHRFIGARGDLQNRGDTMLFISGIDSLGLYPAKSQC